jgi:dTDP-6-deoxy-L-talose 4-dehydrogenase (NAD+)
MKVALTGGTGFIGQHVRKLLAKTNHEVLLVVREQAKIGELGANEKFVTADISEDRNDWFNCLGRPDVLLHLAWGGLPNYLDSYHVDVELPSQVKFLNNLIIGGLCQLVVTGTCYEYGLTSGALVESQETNPNTPYGIAKDRLRKSLSDLRSEFEFELTWARIFYPYGDGQSEMSIYSQLRVAMLKGDQQFKMGSGKQILDFISVEKVASALVYLSTRCAGVGLVNVGSGEPQSVLDFVNDQIRVLGAQLEPLVGALPDRNFESQAFWADTTKSQSLFAGVQLQ